MRIWFILILLFVFSIEIIGHSKGCLQAANVSAQQSTETSEDEEIDDADPYGTGEVDDDIIIDEEETNDDEGVTSG